MSEICDGETVTGTSINAQLAKARAHMDGAQYALYCCRENYLSERVYVAQGMSVEQAHTYANRLNRQVGQIERLNPNAITGRWAPVFGIALHGPNFYKNGPLAVGDLVLRRIKTEPRPLAHGATTWLEYWVIGRVESIQEDQFAVCDASGERSTLAGTYHACPANQLRIEEAWASLQDGWRCDQASGYISRSRFSDTGHLSRTLLRPYMHRVPLVLPTDEAVARASWLDLDCNLDVRLAA